MERELNTFSDTCTFYQMPSVHNIHQMDFKNSFPFGQVLPHWQGSIALLLISYILCG